MLCVQPGGSYPDSEADEDDKKKRRRKGEDETDSSEAESDDSSEKQTKRRARGRAGRDMVRGFTDAELRRLVKSMRKFPRPKDR